MCARIDIGINPHGYRRHPSARRRNIRQCQQFGFRFDIKTPDPVFKRRQHFLPCFTDTREHDFVCRTPRGDHALQFTARHHIKPGAKPGQHIEHSQVGIGFHRITN